MKKEIKIKNIILILNKLLLKNRNTNYNENENDMNKILFDKNIIDLKNGIEDGIIAEITESIMKSG